MRKLIAIGSKVGKYAMLLYISSRIEEYTRLIRIDISKIYPDGYIYMLGAILKKNKQYGN